MDKISIVVPVYNSERYLGKCVEGVITQTYQNWELILVDDGSVDKSAAICDEYAAQDLRIKVFHKKNGGVSSARNRGMDNATGKWVTFLDSDDYYDSEFLEGLISRTQGADLVVGGFRWFGDYDVNWYISQTRYLQTKEEIGNLLNFEYGDSDEMKEKSVFLYPWGKLYKMDIIRNNNIHFNENMKVAEDLCFVLSFVTHIKSLSLVESNHYNYLVIKGRQDYMLNAEQLSFHIRGFNETISGLEDAVGMRLGVTRRFMERTFLNMFLKRLKRSKDFNIYRMELKEYEKSARFFESYISCESLLERLKICVPLYLPRLYFFILRK